MENPDLEHAGEMNRSSKEQLKALAPLLRTENNWIASGFPTCGNS